MEDIKLIDAKLKLQPELLQEFLRLVNKDDVIIICLESHEYGEHQYFTNQHDLFNELQKDEIPHYLLDNDSITLMTEKVAIIFLAQDYRHWFLESVRRRNRLIKLCTVSDEIASQPKLIWKVAIGTLTEDGIKHIRVYEDEKSEIIRIMNNEIVARNGFTTNVFVVFNFNYVDENDEYEIDKWQSLDDLVKKGVVTLA